MAKVNIQELKSMNELTSSLTPENVYMLQEILGIPHAIVEKTKTNQFDFINSLKFKFDALDPRKFHETLRTIDRGDLIPIANKIEWLNVAAASRTPKTESFPSAESFVSLLRNEVNNNQWKMILGAGLPQEVATEIDFDIAFKLCIEGGLISQDMEYLCEMMKAVSRDDLVGQIQKHSSVFKYMNETEFQSIMMEELESDETENQDDWVSRLREYTLQQHEKVYIHFDDEEAIALESVYTPLTIVEEKLMKIKANEETSLNEIAFLKAMSEKEKSLKVVDFISIISEHDPNNPQILCLIGNPGCGKTFLCKYLALQYGNSKHTNFKYLIMTQCRSEEWHTMEKTRQEGEKEIDEEFIQKWLSYSMPVDINWAKSLGKHLTKTGGESLLLIIDGVDEFIKDVPFKTTLLYFLLQKRSLTRATILLTSRPGAWNELREEHAQELKICNNYQVLGFSPTDRDSYFKERISTEAKLNDTKELFFRHDEINQLSLVPVNASLFTSLFNATNNILSQTLTHLYSALIVYIIRRQLSRMGLKKLTRVECVAQFHPSVFDCIGCIGEEAYEGIFHRELSCREEDISIRVDSSEYKTERLGLMQVQVKLLKLGQRVNVWTFAHLTLQEYMAAVYLSNKTWVMQCVMIRFIVSTQEVFAMYKMVVRFLCGLLSNRAACLIPIICCSLIPDVLSFKGLPMVHQLGYIDNIFNVSDWEEFTTFYLLICTMIVETSSRLINNYFRCLSDLLPENMYFHFDYSVSPNEWHCFLISLKYIKKMEIVFIRMTLINPLQFNSLLHQLSFCSLRYLALHFVKQDYNTIRSYTNCLVPTNYKISIAIIECKLPESQPSSPLFPSINNKWTGSIKLYESEISHDILTHLINQFSCVENLFYQPKSDTDWSILQPLISNNGQINGLHIWDTKSYLPMTADILAGLSSLEELSWYKEDAYTVLPHLQTNNNLCYLSLYSPRRPPLRYNYQQQLINVITNNSTSLRDIYFVALHTAGFNSWTSFLSPIQSCCNLMSLTLDYSPFTSDDISYWNTAILDLQSLVELCLVAIPLLDTGLMTLFKSLNRHPAIRSFMVCRCKSTSNSCEPIEMLIHTLPYLRLLRLHKPELSLPDANPLQLLQQTAELFSVKVEFV